jgi:hypothetical protein
MNYLMSRTSTLHFPLILAINIHKQTYLMQFFQPRDPL